MKKYFFWHFAFCGLWARKIGIFVENIWFGSSKLQSSRTKTFCWKQHFFMRNLTSVSFCFSASIIEETLFAFPKNTGGFVKNAFYARKASFFWEKKNFRKFFLISFWDMGQKTLAFQLFFPRLCQNFNLLVHWTVLMISFSKNSQLFFWLNGTWQKKLQPFVVDVFGGVVTTSFLRVHSNFWWKKNWQFFEICHQCRRLSHTLLDVLQNFSCVVVITLSYSPIGRFWLEKILLKKLWYFF